MSTTFLIRDDGGPRGWAHARLLGTVLSALGYTISRVMAGSAAARGALVGELPDLDLGELERRLVELRNDPALQPYLDGVSIAPLSPDAAQELTLAPLDDARIALFGSAGAPYHHLDVFAAAGFDVAPIGADAIRAGALAAVDVFVMPGGGWAFMDGQLGRLGVEGARVLRGFVEAGGTYLSSCAGTHSVLQQPPEAIADWHPAYREMPKLSAKSWLTGTRATNFIRSPGIGVIHVRPHDADHPLALGLPAEFDSVYYNGPILMPTDGQFISVLDCVAADPDQFTVGEKLLGRDLVAETAVAEACAGGFSAGGLQPYGQGWIVGFGLHPEFGAEPTMLDWGIAARLLVNAAEWTTSQSRAAHVTTDRPAFDPRTWSATRGTASPRVLQEAALAHLSRIEARFTALAQMPASEVAPWLDREVARSAFGRGPESSWASTLANGARLAGEITARLTAWRTAWHRLDAPLASLPDAAIRKKVGDLRENAMRILALPAVDTEPQDLGFKGLAALLSDAKDMLNSLTVDGEFVPYKAVAMSYLSAFGYLAAASLSLSASQAMLARGQMLVELSGGDPVSA